jgi:hypothetical protein
MLCHHHRHRAAQQQPTTAVLFAHAHPRARNPHSRFREVARRPPPSKAHSHHAPAPNLSSRPFARSISLRESARFCAETLQRRESIRVFCPSQPFWICGSVPPHAWRKCVSSKKKSTRRQASLCSRTLSLASSHVFQSALGLSCTSSRRPCSLLQSQPRKRSTLTAKRRRGRTHTHTRTSTSSTRAHTRRRHPSRSTLTEATTTWTPRSAPLCRGSSTRSLIRTSRRLGSTRHQSPQGDQDEAPLPVSPPHLLRTFFLLRLHHKPRPSADRNSASHASCACFLLVCVARSNLWVLAMWCLHAVGTLL